MMRSFVAVRVPERVSSELMATQAGLPAGRPVPRENFHLTLSFLGEHPEPVVEDVHHQLATIRTPRFRLELEGLDAFGGNRIRLLCARARLSPSLETLNARVRQAARLAGLSLPRERYVPHVTLARLNGQGAVGDEAQRLRDFAALRAGFRAGFEVESFCLIRSHLKQGGPIYEDLAEYALL
jgi:RNA 2',3'-cyclic 3'-phosphodiesterase